MKIQIELKDLNKSIDALRHAISVMHESYENCGSTMPITDERLVADMEDLASSLLPQLIIARRNAAEEQREGRANRPDTSWELPGNIQKALRMK